LDHGRSALILFSDLSEALAVVNFLGVAEVATEFGNAAELRSSIEQFRVS
jgi:hypothetical protein